jgi:hypothetical protein
MSKVYLDLDGVFADFESAVRRYTTLNYSDDPIKAWGMIDKVPNFFKRLYPLSGALRLFDTIYDGSTLPVEMLTAMPDQTGLLHTVAYDKEYWCHKYLSQKIKVNTVQGWEQKALFAQPGCILVDDSFRNIQDWVACGGTGVHHTSNWNTIQELRMVGVLK